MADQNSQPTPKLDPDPGLTQPPPTKPGAAPTQTPTPQANAAPQAEFGRPDLLTGRNPAAPGKFTVDVEALQPAVLKAGEISGDLHRLAKEVGVGAPPGTPGFATGFQIGALNAAWGAEISAAGDAAQTAGDKILRTRWAFIDTESAVKAGMTPGA